jgi:hypothetical protein
MRKLDCVGKQVDQNLLHAHPIETTNFLFEVAIDLELHILNFSLVPQEVHGFFHDGLNTLHTVRRNEVVFVKQTAIEIRVDLCQ